MTLSDRIHALVRTVPPETLVPVSWLAGLLDAEQHASEAPAPGVDLTVAEVALKFGRGTSTVRTWLARGDLAGAYRLHGREWRIPATALAAMQAAQGAQFRQQRTPTTAPAALGAWRDHLKRSDDHAA